MRIVYCIPSLYYASGMERVLTLKVNYFAEHFGWDIHIILTDGKERAPYFALHPNITVHQLDINYDALYGKNFLQKSLSYFRKQRLFKKQLTNCLMSIRPDITVSLLRRDINFISDIQDGSVKVGEIHFNRANYRDFTDNKFPHFIQRTVQYFWNKQLIDSLRKLEAFVVLTHEDAACWTELSNTIVIPNPLPHYPDHSAPLEARQVIAAGRYMPEKGFDRLIDAWKIVSDQYPDWVLRIYGDGMREELQQQIDALGLRQHCILEHTVPNIFEKYQESSIFALSSRFEGFGMVLIEAMSCGVPAVAFACPSGPREIITDGEDGILIDNGNIPALAEKICFLIERPESRKKMGAAARQNVQRFRIEEVAGKWKQLFLSLKK